VKAVFFFFYFVLSVILYIAAVPVVVLLSFKKKYRYALPARFFLRRNPPFNPGGIWFHVCSFGEARAVAPLVEPFSRDTLRMSTTTQTGMSVIETYTDQSRYLPFEPLLCFWMKPQKVLVVFEAELWYMLFALAKRKGAHTMLINARISERSYPKYRRFAWLYRHIFAHIDEVFAQSEEDKTRLESLGARHIKVTGNIKLASLPTVTQAYAKPSAMTVCAASTHEGEEELILEAFAAFKAGRPKAVLLVVPRHPERFDKAAALCEEYARRHGWTWARFSQTGTLEGADIVLVDAMGELVNCYAVSDAVVLGGSFVPVGGHNAAEAAQFGCKIITGPHIFNQRDMYAAIASVYTIEPDTLPDVLCRVEDLEPATIRTRSDIGVIVEAIRRAWNSAATEREHVQD